MTHPIPANAPKKPLDSTQFARSPQRDYISFGSVGRPGVMLPGSLPRRSSLVEGISQEERKKLLVEEEDLLADSNLLTPRRRSSAGPSRKKSLVPGGYGSTRTAEPPLLEEHENADEISPLVPTSSIDSSEEEEELIKSTWKEAVAAGTIRTSYRREFLVLLKNSLPVSVTFLLQYSLTVVSVFCVGHLGKNELSAVSLAAMIANITGYGIVQGIATSLDTLAAQAYGREDNEMVGVYTQRCLAIMSLVLIPIFLIWCNAKPILMLFVPQVECCELAALYLKVLSVGAPGYVVFEISKHYLQAQGIFHANTYVLFICAPINVILNYLLVWDESIGVGFVGAPIAVVITDYLMAILSVLYVIYIDGIQCWGGWTKDALSHWGYMSHLALSGVLTIEAEWLAFEVLTFSAANLGTTELATQTILATMCVLCYQIPMSMGISASTRVGNLVGANLAKSAATACKAALYVAFIFGVMNGLILYFLRDKVGALFSSDADVIAMVAAVMPYGALYQVNDSLSAVSGGLLRGQGRQQISGYVNLISYYVFALPIGLYLAFPRGWGLAGLWSGIVLALVTVSVVQIYVVLYADWDAIIEKAMEEFNHENEEEYA